MLVVILSVAALLRLWRINELPPGFHFDESFEGLEAWRILTDPSYRPIYLTGNFGVPPFNAYANAISFAIAEALGGEAGPTAMRVTSAVLGVLTVVFLFALAQEMRLRLPERISPALPWLAAASLAGMRWHLHFSRMGIEPVQVPLFWTLAMWLLLRAWRTGAWWAYAALGIALGAGMYTYQGAWVIPPLAALVALHLLWTEWAEREQRPRRWWGLVVAALLSIAVLLPLILLFIEQPDLLLMRPAQLVIVGETSSPADSTIGDTLWATAKMFGPFGYPGDLDPRRNIPGAAALNVWQAVPFYLGLLVALWYSRRFWQRESVVMAMPLVGLVGLLLPGVVSEYAPHFHRILGASAPTALLCAIGLDAIWRGVNSLRFADLRGASGALMQYAGALVVTLLLIAGTITSARDYFVRWATLPDLFYAFDVGFWELGQWVAQQPSSQTIYISPQGENHTTLAFAWRERLASAESNHPIRYDGRYVFPLLDGENPEPERYVVIEHEDFRTPLLLPGVFPNHTIDYTIRDPQGKIYAQVYTRPAATLPAREPKIVFEAAVGDGIVLLGYDILPEPVRVGGSLYVQYHWLVDEPPSHDWTIFTHLVDQSGTLVAGFDSPPGRGALVTTRWQQHWRVLDEYELLLPPELLPGEYTLRMGLYDGEGHTLPEDGNGITLGQVRIEE